MGARPRPAPPADARPRAPGRSLLALCALGFCALALAVQGGEAERGAGSLGTGSALIGRAPTAKRPAGPERSGMATEPGRARRTAGAAPDGGIDPALSERIRETTAELVSALLAEEFDPQAWDQAVAGRARSLGPEAQALLEALLLENTNTVEEQIALNELVLALAREAAPDPDLPR